MDQYGRPVYSEGGAGAGTGAPFHPSSSVALESSNYEGGGMVPQQAYPQMGPTSRMPQYDTYPESPGPGATGDGGVGQYQMQPQQHPGMVGGHMQYSQQPPAPYLPHVTPVSNMTGPDSDMMGTLSNMSGSFPDSNMTGSVYSFTGGSHFSSPGVNMGIPASGYNPSPEAFPQAPACSVCGDKGSGLHYGVLVCDGCKNFFKRSVLNNTVGECQRDGRCNITRTSRSRCPACRFDRCLSVGMKRPCDQSSQQGGAEGEGDGATNKRVRKTSSSPAYASSGDVPEPVNESSTAEPKVPKLEEMLAKLTGGDIDLVPEDPPPPGVLENPNSASADQLMTFAYAELRLIIKWAKTLPGFNTVHLPLQIALLKSSFLDLSIFRLSYRSLKAGDGLIHFTKTLHMKLDDIYSQGWNLGVINGTAEFTMRLDDMDIDHPEYCILSVLTLLTRDDSPDAEVNNEIKALEQRYLDLLRYYERRHRPDKIGRSSKLILKLPTLHTIASEAKRSFLRLVQEGSVHVDALVAEMMNIDETSVSAPESTRADSPSDPGSV